MKNDKPLFMGRDITRTAKVCGLPYVTVWRHAKGWRSISPDMALKYAAALGIPLHDLRPDLWPAPDAVTSPNPSTGGGMRQ